ncbi:MAG: hypothetical protein ABI851_01390 [Saprospiraceae bacterium]
MLNIFNLKATKLKVKKQETKKTEKKAAPPKLSRKESKELKAKTKQEYCGNDDDLGYC